MIETISRVVRVLVASAIVEVCETVDENLARWARRRVAKQRTRAEGGSRPEAET
jgi:hypothetical protein